MATPASRFNGVQITSLASSPVQSGAAGLWWDGNTTGPKWRKADGTDITLSAGGSTGNWTFSGNNADLSAAGAMGIGLTTATGITLGQTTLPNTDGALNLGSLAKRWLNVYSSQAYLSSIGASNYYATFLTFNNTAYGTTVALQTGDGTGALAFIAGSGGTYLNQYTGALFQGNTTVAFSATPALNFVSAIGTGQGVGLITVGPVTGNITGATMTGGNKGQRAVIHFLKDATANAYTITFSGTNIRSAGTITMSTTASSITSVAFVWDPTLTTPAWVQESVALNGL